MKGVTDSIGCGEVVAFSLGRRSKVGCHFRNPTAVCESEIDN